MPKGKDNIKAAGTFAVTNTGKRPRRVGRHRFPGAAKGKPSTVEVTLDPREHLQVRSCKSLEVKRATAKGKGGGGQNASGQGSGGDGQKSGGDQAKADS